MCLPMEHREAFFSESPEVVSLPEALDRMLGELSGVFSRVPPETARTLMTEIQHAHRIFGCAMGRSGFILRGFLMRLMHLGLTVYVVGETITPRIHAGDLLMVISGSGETAQPREVLRRANAVGARTLAVTAVPASTIAQEAQVVIYLPGTTKLTLLEEPASVQCPGSLFEQATFMFLEAVVLLFYQQRLGRDRQALLSRHTNLE